MTVFEFLNKHPEYSGELTWCSPTQNLILWEGVSQKFLDDRAAGLINVVNHDPVDAILIYGATAPDYPEAYCPYSNYDRPHWYPVIVVVVR